MRLPRVFTGLSLLLFRISSPPPCPSFCMDSTEEWLRAMSVNPSNTKPSSSSLGRNRGSQLLSKFRSQLGQRNRSINDFYLEPDDPWRSYFPGDKIKGTVVLAVVRPVRITHLVVCLHGHVNVFKNTVPSGEVPPDLGFLGPGRGRRGAEYLGSGLATLFEDEVVLCGEGRLKEGIYKFRFEMAFPPYPLPSSINVCRTPSSTTPFIRLSIPILINVCCSSSEGLLPICLRPP